MSKFISWLETLRPISLPALSINFLLVLACFWLLFTQFHHLPPAVPLWFSKAWDLARLANPGWLWSIPIGAGLILVGNNFLASLIKTEKVLANLLVWFSTFLSLVTLYSLYRLLLLAS